MAFPTVAPTSGVTMASCGHEEPFFIGDLATAASDCALSCPTGTFSSGGQAVGGHCTPCLTVGCAACSEEFCSRCLPLHTAADNQCIYFAVAMAAALSVLAAGLFLCTLLWQYCAAAISNRGEDQDVLKEALAHRRRARLHDYSVNGSPLYSMKDTRLIFHNVAGVGVMLYFRFVGLTQVLCFITSLCLLLKICLPRLVGGQVSADQASAAQAVATYAVCLLVVLSWARSQDRLTKRILDDEPQLQNYALLAEGLPKSARSAHEVKAYFESVLGAEMEGVSIAYDHSEELEFVRDRISRAVEKADVHLGVYHAHLAGPESTTVESQDGYVIDCFPCSGRAFLVFSCESDRAACQRRFDDVGRRFHAARGGAGSDDEEDGAAETANAAGNEGGFGTDDGSDEAQALLRRVTTTKNKAKRSKLERAALFRGKHAIRVQPAPEPFGIQWHNYVVRRNATWNWLGIVFCVLVLAVLVCGGVFVPAVMYEMTYANMSPGTQDQLVFALLEQAAVSVCIATSNRLYVLALRRAAEASGYLNRVSEDVGFVICSLLLFLLNALVPLIIASAYAASEETVVLARLAVEWLFHLLWVNLLVTEVDHVAAPAWRFWSARFWLQERSSDITVREALPVLVGESFRFAARYTDILHSLSITCIMIALDPTSMYVLVAHCLMLLYAIYVFWVDKYMFLRMSSGTFACCHFLDVLARVILVVPLSALLVWVLKELGVALGSRMFRGCVGGHVLVVGVTLAAMARLGATRGEPQRTGKQEVPYVEAATIAPYNYFNTNHVHVLRCMHFPSILVPPIFPYVPGKEYLQGGQFADNDGAVPLRETLLLLARAPMLQSGGAHPRRSLVYPGI